MSSRVYRKNSESGTLDAQLELAALTGP